MQHAIAAVPWGGKGRKKTTGLEKENAYFLRRREGGLLLD